MDDVPVEEKSAPTSLLDKSDIISEIHAQNIERAKQYGITFEGLRKRHPDIDQAAKEYSDKAYSIDTKFTWITAVSGALGVAVPLIFRKKIASSWPIRTAVALVSGIGAAVIGAITSVSIFGKSAAKEFVELQAKENIALDQEIAAARANAPAQSAPTATAPVPTREPKFPANINPRDPSHAAQAAKDAAQASAAAVTP